MKQYKKVSIQICWLEPQDIVTESGGISFLEWFKSPQVLGWDPSIGEAWE